MLWEGAESWEGALGPPMLSKGKNTVPQRDGGGRAELPRWVPSPPWALRS